MSKITQEAQGSFQDILVDAKPEVLAICESLRRVIVGLHAEFVEVVWPTQKIASFGLGPKKMTEHYAYIAPQASHVNLGFYHGASLDDPAHLLEGTGKAMRHIKIRDIATTQSAAVKALLRLAIEERRRALSA